MQLSHGASLVSLHVVLILPFLTMHVYPFTLIRLACHHITLLLPFAEWFCALQHTS